MKKMLLLIALFGTQITSAQSEKRLSSKLEKVTVYEQGARFERSASTMLKAGSQTIVFYGLPINLDPGSIQIGSNQKLELLSIQAGNSIAENRNKTEAQKKLEADLEKQQLERDNIVAQQDAYRLEAQFLSNNTKLGGDQGYSLEELKQISTYAREQKLKNQLEQQQLGRQLNAVNLRINEINQELALLNRRRSLISGEITVKLNSPQNQNCRFNLVYSSQSNASWSSEYNLDFTDLDKDLGLKHKAAIYQSSGEDWNNVQLMLVTGSPRLNTVMPIIQPQYVNFLYRNGKQKVQRMATREITSTAGQASGVISSDEATYRALDSKNFQVNNQQNRIEYQAPQAYSIAHSKSESIVLREIKLKAEYEYQATPALDPAAYLMAIVQDWEQHRLLAGNVSIYNQGLFIGSSYINFDATSDSLMLSLGQDPGIKINYERIFGKKSKSFLGSDRIDEYEYEISLNNLKNNEVPIRIYDRVPISQNDDIRIKHEIENGGKIRDPKTGIIEWEMNLAPKKEQKIKFSYELRYPKDQQVNH